MKWNIGLQNVSFVLFPTSQLFDYKMVHFSLRPCERRFSKFCVFTYVQNKCRQNRIFIFAKNLFRLEYLITSSEYRALLFTYHSQLQCLYNINNCRIRMTNVVLTFVRNNEHFLFINQRSFFASCVKRIVDCCCFNNLSASALQ